MCISVKSPLTWLIHSVPFPHQHRYRQKIPLPHHPDSGCPILYSGFWRVEDELAGHAAPAGWCTSEHNICTSYYIRRSWKSNKNRQTEEKKKIRTSKTTKLAIISNCNYQLMVLQGLRVGFSISRVQYKWEVLCSRMCEQCLTLWAGIPLIVCASIRHLGWPVPLVYKL